MIHSLSRHTLRSIGLLIALFAVSSPCFPSSMNQNEAELSLEAPPPAEQASEQVHFVAPVMPRFEGQDLRGFMQWIKTHLEYPAEAYQQQIEGKVVASFIIEKDGTLSTVEIMRSPSSLLSEEVLRILPTSPAWTPGSTEDNQPIRVRLTIPIDFTLAHDSDNTETQAEDEAPCLMAETMPSFEGGDLNTFREWIQTQIHYTSEMYERRIKGKVISTFIIEKDGSLSEVRFLGSSDPILVLEAERVLLSSPRWTPAYQQGRPVRIRYNLPILFDPDKAKKRGRLDTSVTLPRIRGAHSPSSAIG